MHQHDAIKSYIALFFSTVDEPGGRESSKSLGGLPDSTRSLIDFNPNLTESWFEPVCTIIKDLQSSKSGCDPLDKMECADCNDSDKNAQLSKIQGKFTLSFQKLYS